MDITIGEFLISDDKELLQIEKIHDLLSRTYWAKDREIGIIKHAIENSLCFGVYSEGRQVGFARCVTDYATIYWLADVVIDEEYRGRGLGKALIGFICGYEQLSVLRGILFTDDAHGLYERYGFVRVPDEAMTRAGQ